MSEEQDNVKANIENNSFDDRGPVPLEGVRQLQPEDTLVQEDVEDILDRGWSPPDTDRGSRMHGVTAAEQGREETIEERIAQEVPDPASAYGAPDNESGLDVDLLGDDPDTIPAAEDWLGGEVGAERAGRLVAPDQGLTGDEEKDLVGFDVGFDGAAASAEEAAIHVVPDADPEE
jgi:hypothetical protein